MKLPDIPFWFAGGLHLGTALVMLKIMDTTKIDIFIVATLFLVINSIGFMFNLSNIISSGGRANE